MELTILGTGNPIPDAARAGAATLVQAGSANLLVDAGRGVLMRLVGAGLLPSQLSAVLVTHLHSDHITDLNDVITMHWVMSAEASTLRIFGPPRTREVVDGILAMLAPDISYRLHHHDDLAGPPDIEVVELEPGDTFEVDGTQVTVGRTDHRPVEPTIAFRVEHEGESVVLGGDGVPCETLDELCRGADVYVQTVVREDLVRMVPVKRFVEILDYHSTVQQAAQTAARAEVRTLVLTHYTPALFPGQEDDWSKLATEHFDGEVVVPDDGHRLTVGG